MRSPLFLVPVLMALTACASGSRTPGADALPQGATISESADGSCWGHEEVPAIYEQVMGEIQVVQAEIDEQGNVIRPPIYRRAPVPQIVRPRTEVRFEVPCPVSMTPEFIASVQRALLARGYYTGPINGLQDSATRAAILKYQKDRGLESGQLSIETARSLGLAAIPRDDLKTGG